MVDRVEGSCVVAVVVCYWTDVSESVAIASSGAVVRWLE